MRFLFICCLVVCLTGTKFINEVEENTPFYIVNKTGYQLSHPFSFRHSDQNSSMYKLHSMLDEGVININHASFGWFPLPIRPKSFKTSLLPEDDAWETDSSFTVTVSVDSDGKQWRVFRNEVSGSALAIETTSNDHTLVALPCPRFGAITDAHFLWAVDVVTNTMFGPRRPISRDLGRKIDVIHLNSNHK